MARRADEVAPNFLIASIKRMSLRTSPQTGVAIRLSCLPLGEGGSRVSRKRETDEGKNWPKDKGIVRKFLLS